MGLLWSFIKYSGLLFGILSVIRWFLKKRWESVDRNNEISVKGKTVVITGANAGIGKATALEFARRNANVILACRNLDKAREAVTWIRCRTHSGQLICMQLDLASLKSVKKFSEAFKSKYEQLDILILNAGVMLTEHDRRTTFDGHELHFGVNHLGHFLLTNLLLEPLKQAAPSRVVTLSSMAHSWCGHLDFDDLNYEKKTFKTMTPFVSTLYGKSKLANALFSLELSKRLQGTGVRTYALCPGAVITELGQNIKGPTKWILTLFSPIFQFVLKTPEQGAATTIYCALSKNLINESGKMYQHCGPWDQKKRIQLSDIDAKMLWDESAKLVKMYL